jgi:cytoskeletal protein RodZ
MISIKERSREPLRASPIRRVLHTLIAVAGWVLFGYWWWLVMQRVSQAEVRFTAWFVAIALVVIVLVTALWASHNLRLFKRKGPRTQLRPSAHDGSRDTIGRPVGMPAVPDEYRSASLIVVRIEDGIKVYRPTITRQTPQRLPVSEVKS